MSFQIRSFVRLQDHWMKAGNYSCQTVPGSEVFYRSRNGDGATAYDEVERGIRTRPAVTIFPCNAASRTRISRNEIVGPSLTHN